MPLTAVCCATVCQCVCACQCVCVCAGYDLICARTATLYGAAMYGFPDWMSAHTFRARVYAGEDVVMPETPLLSVTILDRGGNAPRRIDNLPLVRIITSSVRVCVYVCDCNCVCAPS